MFDIQKFIVENLIAGVINGSFAREQANILAANYFIKGYLSPEAVQEISDATTPDMGSTETEDEATDKENI